MTETKELILNSLGILAKLLPEQRMGQIISNYICANCPYEDPFFIDDKKLLGILETTIQEIENKKNGKKNKKSNF